MISVVIGFKDREIKRVKYCLESLSKQDNDQFELIIVDYGSNSELNRQVNDLCDQFTFATCVNNSTRGMVWNRSHALNTGCVLAKGEYIYFGDIDLIYDTNFISHLYQKADENTVVYNQFVLLPEDEWPRETQSISWENLELQTKSARGVFLINKKKYMELGGFDEFYRIWGVEDNDLNKRAVQYGLKEDWTNNAISRSYHIWHATASNFKEGLMPDRWMEEMILHHWSNLNNSRICLKNTFGKLWTHEERPSLKSGENGADVALTYYVPDKGLFDTASLVYRTILENLKEINSGEVLKLIIPKWEESRISTTHSKVLKLIRIVLNRFGSNFILIEKEKYHKYKYFYPLQDTKYFIWLLLTRTDLIKDYYLKECDGHVEYYISKT